MINKKRRVNYVCKKKYTSSHLVYLKPRRFSPAHSSISSYISIEYDIGTHFVIDRQPMRVYEIQ